MKYSIIVPVYNTEKFLRKCLDSAVNQNFSDYEVVIVNDGSTDKSSDIIDEYEERYPDRLVVIHQGNAGLSAARNAGIKVSHGLYLAFLDSDDWISSDFLQCMDDELGRIEELAVVTCGREFVYEKNREIDSLPVFQKTNLKATPSILRTINLSACNKIFHRKLLENNLFPLGKLYEDIYPVTMALVNADSLSMVDKVLYYVRKDNPNSITTSFNKNEFHLKENIEELRIEVKVNYSYLYEDFLFFYNKTLFSYFTKVIQNGRADLVDSSVVDVMEYSKLNSMVNKLVFFLIRKGCFSVVSFALKARKKFFKRK